jgi:hypothetical protein
MFTLVAIIAINKIRVFKEECEIPDGNPAGT